MIGIPLEFMLHMDIYLAALIQDYGNVVYLLLFLIIFLETGFVLTPFLPGDSLLFISGTLAAAGALHPYVLFLLLSIASILGDTVNYGVGYHFGGKVFRRYIKQEHLEKTRLFFHQHGNKTIVLARFIPIIRTFAPFMAGIAKMKYVTFLSYNIIGGMAWVAIFVFSGFYFGNVPLVKNNLTLVILLIILISFIPAMLEYVRHKRNHVENRTMFN